MRADIHLSIQTRRAGKLKGEAVVPDHIGDITVHAWNWGASSNIPPGASTSTRSRSYKHLTVTKSIDSASTALLTALASNDEVKEAKLTMRKAGDGQQDFLTITLKGARIATIDLDTPSTGETVERVSLAFTKVEVEYRPQQASGARGGAFTFSDEVLAPAG